MSTLASLTSGVREYMKSDPNDRIWGLTVKEGALNDGYFQIQKDGNFRWAENEATASITTSSGVTEYALPTDFVKLDMVQNAGTLGELSPTNKRNTMRSGAGQGQPSSYYLFGGKIGFYPTPDGGITTNILYRKKLPVMTSTVGSALTSDFDSAIVRWASYILWSTTKNSQKTVQALEDYKIFLQTLKNAHLFQDANIGFGYQRGVGMRERFNPAMLP